MATSLVAKLLAFPRRGLPKMTMAKEQFNPWWREKRWWMLGHDIFLFISPFIMLAIVVLLIAILYKLQ
jgi:hypothetical protein